MGRSASPLAMGQASAMAGILGLSHLSPHQWAASSATSPFAGSAAQRSPRGPSSSSPRCRASLPMAPSSSWPEAERTARASAGLCRVFFCRAGGRGAACRISRRGQRFVTARGLWPLAESGPPFSVFHGPTSASGALAALVGASHQRQAPAPVPLLPLLLHARPAPRS
jgi:hypothetical protein